MPPKANPITRENRKTGDYGWALLPPAPIADAGYGAVRIVATK